MAVLATNVAAASALLAWMLFDFLTNGFRAPKPSGVCVCVCVCVCVDVCVCMNVYVCVC